MELTATFFEATAFEPIELSETILRFVPVATARAGASNFDAPTLLTFPPTSLRTSVLFTTTALVEALAAAKVAGPLLTASGDARARNSRVSRVRTAPSMTQLARRNARRASADAIPESLGK